MIRSALCLVALFLVAGSAHAQIVPPPLDEMPKKEPPPSEPAEAPKPEPAPAPAKAPAPAPAPAAAPGTLPYTPWMTAPPAAAPTSPKDAVADEKPEEPLPPAGPPGWQAWVGARTSFFTDKGYDPFSTDDVLVVGSIGASRRLLSLDKLSFAGALTFDFGTASAAARGEPTELSMYRLTAGPEARIHLLPSLYAFVRPTAGVQRTVARLDEGSTGTTLYARDWLLAVDASAGAAWAFADLRSKRFDLMFWLVADGGYGFTQSSQLLLQPDENASAPERTAALDLGELSTSGAFFRFAVAGTF